MLNLVQHPIKSRTYQTLKHRRVTSKYFFSSPLDFRFFNLQSATCNLITLLRQEGRCSGHHPLLTSAPSFHEHR